MDNNETDQNTPTSSMPNYPSGTTGSTGNGNAGSNADAMSSTMHQAVDKAASAAHSAADRAAATGQQWIAAQQRFTENACNYVREKPFQAVGAAFAAGFILSWMTRSR